MVMMLGVPFVLLVALVFLVLAVVLRVLVVVVMMFGVLVVPLMLLVFLVLVTGRIVGPDRRRSERNHPRDQQARREGSQVPSSHPFLRSVLP
jgi:hypothetical protein